MISSEPLLRSFVEVRPESHFPIQNLPFGIFTPKVGGRARAGVAIGEMVLDLAVLEAQGFFDGPQLRSQHVFSQPALNAFMALGRPAWQEARATIQQLLRADNPTLRDNAELCSQALWPTAGVTMSLPADIGDYTDFYSSREHATNVGIMFRGRENALMPNWLHLPVAYHGRASSVVTSGTAIHRPQGQTMAEGAPAPLFAPSRSLDFELEMGFFVGLGNQLGAPIPATEAAGHIFGLVLVNDWSARDIQRWEYQPLGPFLAKNFATSISPWVVTLEALAPFRVPGPAQEPEPLPYLRSREEWAYDIHLEALLQSEAMSEPVVITRSNFRHLYWNMAQQLAHHTITGCNLRPGDLLASGTISGPTPDSYGSLLELTWRGERPIQLPSGETRKFLQDGDRLTLTGWGQGDGYRIGFGEVTGQILPARAV
ncbi:MAG: fumarylacetoacetase [Chloroflexi bacterium]|nr:fumarylacetoacetase [Chloroflexota bacterium]MCI0577031.1 fumarylacetoacetase [Chloroflexota bacterium]MCI0648813.1 fumarylacetoacetase [Chloroflexota bacterium]MCI0726315.1 fumarylacetoacetase [Chloroflexota bacterium]